VAGFHIHVVNSEFESSSDIDAADGAEARKQALRSALEIGVDEVCKGSPFVGAEVRVELDGELQERFLVSIGQSPLK
jgi:hypothetical protein